MSGEKPSVLQHLITLKEWLGTITVMLLLAGAFAAWVISAADAKAQGANRRIDEVYGPRIAGLEEREKMHDRAEAAEHELIRTDVAGTRDDVRALYRFHLTKERQPQLERPPPVP
jgi:hypothetical protein